MDRRCAWMTAGSHRETDNILARALGRLSVGRSVTSCRHVAGRRSGTHATRGMCDRRSTRYTCADATSQCDACKHRKVRCDKGSPCSNCKSSGAGMCASVYVNRLPLTMLISQSQCAEQAGMKTKSHGRESSLLKNSKCAARLISLLS